jgi:Ca2+:H+ antiporter
MRLTLKPSLGWFLIFVPVAVLFRLGHTHNNEVWIFVCAGLGIVPLAGLMGEATENLAARMGQGAGALLNASFGNAAELILALIALHKGLISVVKASIVGSIIGNVLLVVGASALAGGIKYSHQKFNRTAVQSSTTSLMLAAIGLLIPTIFHHAAAAHPLNPRPGVEQNLSLAIALVLFATYICTLIFSLRTHRQLFAGEPDHILGAHALKVWSKPKAVLVLAGATALVALLSEFLVDSVGAAQEKLGVTQLFIGTIVVAIIGNAAEHSTAVVMAIKNKLDLSLGIAIGSSLQIALFVAPMLVFVSYSMGKPMSLEFTLPEVCAMIVSVYIAAEISNDGETNWLEGAQLLSLYLILAILFYVLPG